MASGCGDRWVQRVGLFVRDYFPVSNTSHFWRTSSTVMDVIGRGLFATMALSPRG
jgi:hypothetical protein